MTINLDWWLSFLANVVTIGASMTLLLKAINDLQREIWLNKQHLESHCQMLNHIAEHLKQRDGYEPIYKLKS